MDTPIYKQLLLAVDFENTSEPVIERALRMRALTNARLFLLHVVEHVPPGIDFMPVGYAGDLAASGDLALEEELLGLARGELDALGERLDVPEADRLVRVGSPGHMIDEVAAELGADLIIVGSHGRHGFKGLFGSTARAVLRHPVCDVLCVRMEEPAS
ncbi:MAG: universal stress protein [Sphingobacteriia bacterium]|nr:universal stress protein [Sphingobacteriia bacterium]NCC39422.1 universal stress protein [Gammaproteobacteria bacterium]